MPDREISLNLYSLADKIEQRSREADPELCSPKFEKAAISSGRWSGTPKRDSSGSLTYRNIAN
jgi:hypothetical protein